MGMLCGLDLHRGQITFDALIEETGEIWRGRIFSPDRARFRRWLEVDVRKRVNAGAVAMAVEGCTGWRYVVEEIVRAGHEVELSEAARQRIATGYRVIDGLDGEIVPLRRQLQRFSRRQPACKALAEAQYGVGPLTAVITWAELGDCRRFSRSMQVVRHAGLDVTVHQSDRHRPGGWLSREGPANLRWALFEAGKCAARIGSPDFDYYQAVKRRLDGKLATISVARKIARRCYHTLRALDPELVYAMPED